VLFAHVDKGGDMTDKLGIKTQMCTGTGSNKVWYGVWVEFN